ncbi:hypothetical protein KIPB_013510, partial [Kipferlia bialata]|eukprot:g13510.t1
MEKGRHPFDCVARAANVLQQADYEDEESVYEVLKALEDEVLDPAVLTSVPANNIETLPGLLLPIFDPSNALGAKVMTSAFTVFAGLLRFDSRFRASFAPKTQLQ